MHRHLCAAFAVLFLATSAQAEDWSFTSPTTNSDGSPLRVEDQTALSSCEITIEDKDGNVLKSLPIPVTKPLGGEEFTVILSASSAQAAVATQGSFRCDNAAGEKGERAVVARTFRPLRPAQPSGASIQ